MNAKETELRRIIDTVIECCATRDEDGTPSLTSADVLGNSRTENAAYLANWYYSDEYPDYLKTETDVIKRTYKAAQDPDGYEGMTFARWLSDIIGKEIEIDWEKYA